MALTKQGISKNIIFLYEKGYSIQAISTKLKIPKTTARDRLLKAGIPLRTHSNGQLKNKICPRIKSIKTAPYGFCLVQGQLQPDPKEQANLQLILNWWQQGMSHCDIARTLNGKKIKPRKAKEWSQPTIGYIIKRHQGNKSEKNCRWP